jgi:hypothetical protein
MDHLATELAHPPQRGLEVVHLEVGQGMRVARSLAALMHAERWRAACCLPALALAARSVGELRTQDSGPKAPGALRIVGRELDEVNSRAHQPHDTLPAMRARPRGAPDVEVGPPRS